MIFKVVVHRNSIMFPTIGEYLVESTSAEIAATFALSVAKCDYPDEGGLHVVSCLVVAGDFIGRAAQHRVQRTPSKRGDSARSRDRKSKVSSPARSR